MKIVVVVGSYDVLHFGHFKLLEHASKLGDYVVALIDEDERVRERKGADRPHHNVEQRMFNLDATRYVDEVLTFGSDDELTNKIKELSPEYMVLGSDWDGKKIIGYEHVKEVVFFGRIPLFSSTNILNK